ncbi:hypothetical protein [Rhizobium sp. 9140]|uniref:hypothetical protein n=1 Tax=Rhizobium sp. 9140 TaxID=1761900 RepID=UPI0007942813|nr:hypothetical protein [Rhizobium sp. 9140]CZT36249.1 hypothetical protein GA0004734_00032490 [Rhizobium sp. 9140]
MARREEIDRLRAAQAGGAFSSDLNARLGVNGYGTSARGSAAVFEEAARDADRYAQKAASLRAQLDPVGASQARLNSELAEYAMLADRAEISTAELAQAQMMAKARHEQYAASVNRSGANDNRPEGRAFNTSNLAAQGFDVLATAGSMPFYTVALQQGPQVAAVFNDIRASGQAIGPAVAGAFAQILNPVSLLTIGVIGATAAAASYFSSVEWGGGKSEETLKKEAALIAAVAQKWGEALPALKAYNEARESAATGKEIKEAADKAADDQWTTLRKQITDVNIAMTDTASQLQQLGRDEGQVGNLQRDFAALEKAIGNGTATSEMARGVQRDLASLIKDGSTPAIDAFVKSLDFLPAALDKAAVSASGFKTEAAVLVDLVKQLGPLGQLGPIISGDGRFMTNPNEIQTYNAEQAALREANENPTVTNPQGVTVGVPIPTRKPIQLGDDLAKSEKDADRVRESYDRMIRTANDRIEQIQAESAMVGQAGVAVAAYRFQLDLLNRVEQQGAKATPAQRAEIEKLGQAYKVAATEAANLKLAADLKFETEQEYRNRTDQDIASRQRGAGLDVDLNSEFANGVRELERIKQARADLGGFFTDLRDGLMQGDSIGEAFGNAFLKSLMNVTGRITDNLINSLLNSVLGQPGTASTAGTGLLNLITGSAAPAATSGAGIAGPVAASAAPVMAVTRSAIPATDISSYITEAATKRGIDAGIALRVAQSEGGLNSWNLQSGFVKNGVREASYGPFQLYKGGGLGNEFQRATGMDPALASSGPAGVDFALDHAKKNGWGAWYGAKRVGIDKWEGIGQGANTQNDTAAAAVERMAANSNEAATNLGGLTSATSTAMQGVGDFGAGLGQFSQQLMNAASGANSPSSLLGGLGSLLGGISPTSPFWAPNTTLGSFLTTGKAGGGYTGPGGINEPAGITHKGEIVWSQMDIARAGGVGTVEGMRLGWQGYASGGLVGGPASAPQRRSTIQDAANDSAPAGRKAGDTGSITIRGGDVIVQGDVSEKNLKAIQDAIEENNRFLPDRIEEHRRHPRKRMAG